MADKSEQQRKLTVVGMTGELLLDAVEVSSLAELQELILVKMGSSKFCTCRLLTADGHPLNTLEEADNSTSITAVVVPHSPLLQMVGLQDDKGNLLDPAVPQEPRSDLDVFDFVVLDLMCRFP